MFSVVRRRVKSQGKGADKARRVTKLAWLVIGGITALCLIAVVLHVMRSDIDPIRFTVSNYAHGPYGFLMTAAFFVFAMSLLALALGLSRTIISQRKTRAGVLLLKAPIAGAEKGNRQHKDAQDGQNDPFHLSLSFERRSTFTQQEDRNLCIPRNVFRYPAQ